MLNLKAGVPWLVEVTWLTAWESDEYEPHQIQCAMRTVGYVVAFDSDRLALTAELDPDDEAGAVTYIPTAAIVGEPRDLA